MSAWAVVTLLASLASCLAKPQYDAGGLEVGDFSPNMGPIDGNTTVTILVTGAGPESVFKVKFYNDVSEQTMLGKMDEDGRVTVQTPTFWIACIVNIAVSANGNAYVPLGEPFYYYDPTFTGLKPVFGPAEGGTMVSVSVNPGENIKFKQALAVSPLTSAKWVEPVNGTEIIFPKPCTVVNNIVTCETPQIPENFVGVDLELMVSVNRQQWIPTEKKKFKHYAIEMKAYSPISGPITGNTQIDMAVSGLIVTGYCMVRMNISAEEATYSEVINTTLEGDVPGVYEGVSFKTPPSPVEGIATLELSLNGKDWVTGSEVFTFYDIKFISFSPQAKLLEGNAGNTSAGEDPDEPVNDPVALTIRMNGGSFANLLNESVTKFVDVNDKNNTKPVACEVQGNNALECGTPDFPDKTTVVVEVAMNGQQFVRVPGTFYYYNVKVQGLSPRSGPINGETAVMVFGTGYNESLGVVDCKMWCAGKPVNTGGAAFFNDKQLLFKTVPVPAPTSCQVYFTLNGLQYSEIPFKFNYYDTKYTDVTPKYGMTNAGFNVTISGTGFINASETLVKIFNVTKDYAFTAPAKKLEGQKLSVFVPVSGSADFITKGTFAGGANLAVAMNGQQFEPVMNFTTNKFRRLTFIDAAVDLVTPACGPVAGNSSVTILGRGFHAVPPMLVKFTYVNLDDWGEQAELMGANSTLYEPTFKTEYEMTVLPRTVLKGVAAKVDVSFSGEDENYLGYTKGLFKYYESKFFKFFPTAGPVAGGTVLTVTGEGFVSCGASSAIKFCCETRCQSGMVTEAVGNATVVNDTVVSAVTPSIVLPPGALKAELNVKVAINGKTWEPMVENVQFLFYSDKYTKFYPTTGPSTGNTTVIVLGEGFVDSGLASVRLSCKILHKKPMIEVLTVPATVHNATHLEFSTPPWVDARDVDVEVSLNGQNWKKMRQIFEYYVPPPGSVASIPAMEGLGSFSADSSKAVKVEEPGSEDMVLLQQQAGRSKFFR